MKSSIECFQIKQSGASVVGTLQVKSYHMGLKIVAAAD